MKIIKIFVSLYTQKIHFICNLWLDLDVTISTLILNHFYVGLKYIKDLIAIKIFAELSLYAHS